MLPAPLKRLFTAPGHRFALLVALGMGVVVMPVAEVWRRQGLEVQAIADARRALEPVALAVSTQRALSAHRPYAAAVLAGRTGQEAERLRRQRAADGEVGALVAALEARHLHRALAEADQLRDAWSNLLEDIGGRRLLPAASNAAHDLLIEQAFVIMDLVAGAGGLHGQAGRAVDVEAMALVQQLPRFAEALAGWTGNSETEFGLEVDGAAAARRAAAEVGEADAASAPAMPPPAASRLRTLALRVAQTASGLLDAAGNAGFEDRAPDPALVQALSALHQHATGLAEAVAPAAVLVRRAQGAAIEASAALFVALDAALAEAASDLQRERMLAGASGLLALLIGALAAVLAVPRRAPPEGPVGPTADAADAPDTHARRAALMTALRSGGAESEGPAADLLLRLRRQEIGAAAQPQAPAPQGPSGEQARR